MRLLVITFLAFTRLSWVEAASGLADPPASIETGPKPVRAAVASWLRKELDLLTHFMKVIGVQEESVRDVTEFTDSIIASPDFSDNKLRIVSQVFDVIRNEYISGTLPDNNQLLLCAIRAELEYHVGPHSKIAFYNELTERSRRVIDLVRVRDRVLPSLWNTSDLLLSSFYERTLWMRNVLSIDDAELDQLELSLRTAFRVADDLSVQEAVDVRDSFPPLSIISLYTSSKFDSLGQETRLMRLARSIAVYANQEMLDLAVHWGRIYSSSSSAVVTTPVYTVVHSILEECMNGQQLCCDAARSLGRFIQNLGARLGSFRTEMNLRSQYYLTVFYLDQQINSGQLNTAGIDGIPEIGSFYPVENEMKRLTGEQVILIDKLNALATLNDGVGIRLKRLIRDLIDWDSTGSPAWPNLMVAEAVIHKLPELDETERLWVDRILSKWMRNHKSPGGNDTSEREDFSMLIELYKWTGIVAYIKHSRIIELVTSIADVSMFSERSRSDFTKRYGDAGYFIDATDHDFSGILSKNLFFMIAYFPESLPMKTLEAYRTVMLDFQSESPAISGFIPEVDFRYLGFNTGPLSGQLTHWRATERMSDLFFDAFNQDMSQNIPSLPADGIRYIREMQSPLQLVGQLAERVESVYRNKLEDLLALMRRFPQLESSNFIRALTGLPRAVWYTVMSGGLIGRRTHARFPALITAVMVTGNKLIEVFEAVPTNDISNETIDETCLVSLMQTLQDWTHLCASHGRLLDLTSPVTDEQIENSISQFVRVSNIFDRIVEARFMDCKSIEPAALTTIGISQDSCSHSDGRISMGSSADHYMHTFFYSPDNKKLNAYQFANPYPDLSKECQRCIDGIMMRARGREEALISTWHDVQVPQTLQQIEMEFRELCFSPAVRSTLPRTFAQDFIAGAGAVVGFVANWFV